MRETVTGGWRLRKPKAVRSTRRGGSGNLARLSVIIKLGQARWLLAMLVGLAWALAYPEPRWSVFAWLVPGCLLSVVSGREGWRLFGLAFLAALVFRLVSLRFLLNIPHTGGAIGGWLALSVYAALFSAAWAWICGVWFRCGLADQNWPWIKRFCFGLFAAAVWVGIEMFQARALGGYPWNFLGVTQFENNPLIQIAAFTGVYGVSFLIVWFSVSVLFAILKIRRATANPWSWMTDLAAPCVVLVCVCTFGFLRLDVIVKISEPFRVAVVQPSIPQRLIWESGNKEERMDKVLELSELALVSKPDVLIWPESSAPVTQENWPRVKRLLLEANTPLVLGIDDFERDADTGEDRFYNSAAFVPVDDSAPVVYRKRRLVMFGEYIPFEKALPFMKYLSPIGASFSAGTEAVQFPVGEGKTTMAPVICYEDAFPHGVREHVLPGTTLLVNLTNDGWFGEGPAQWQHAANAVFRCIENRVPMVRSCNNGLSCWVDRFGQVRRFFGEENGDIYGAGFAVFEIPLGQALGRSFYNRHGDVFGWSCFVLGLAGIIARLAKRRLHTRRKIG